MSVESKLEVLYVDEKTKKVERLSGKDLTDQLEKLKKALEYMLGKMQNLAIMSYRNSQLLQVYN